MARALEIQIGSAGVSSNSARLGDALFFPDYGLNRAASN
jgi:hypothetical protein